MRPLVMSCDVSAKDIDMIVVASHTRVIRREKQIMKVGRFAQRVRIHKRLSFALLVCSFAS